MRTAFVVSVAVTLALVGAARAQAVGGAYLNGPGVISEPIQAQQQVIATGQPPLGVPTGGAAVQGGMGSLPGTGAGASMDAFGHLAVPAAGACVNCQH